MPTVSSVLHYLQVEKVISGAALGEYLTKGQTPQRKYEVGDRVVYTQKTCIHKGALPHGSICNATVITAFGGDDPTQWPVYRLQLDEVWSADRCKERAGQPIVVGNIIEKYLSPNKE